MTLANDTFPRNAFAGGRFRSVAGPVIGLVLLGAVLALGGCGDGGSDTPKGDFPASSDPAGPVPEAQLGKINAVVAGVEWVVGSNNFVVGITNADDEPQGGATVEATFFDLRDTANPRPMFKATGVQSAPGVGPVVQHQHTNGDVHEHGGEEDGRVGYYFDVNFDHAGQWGIEVSATLKNGTRGLSRVAFLVAERTDIAVAGQPAPPSDNLTAAEVDDIKQIDSGTPPNDMHDVKIKDSIAAGRPLVVVFATPAFCTSRFCGPVVEEMEALHEEFHGKVDFVHVEIWEDYAARRLAPAVGEWITHADGSLSEPFVYVVGADGVIYDRWEGPIAANIVRGAVEAVASGKLYGDR